MYNWYVLCAHVSFIPFIGIPFMIWKVGMNIWLLWRYHHVGKDTSHVIGP